MSTVRDKSMLYLSLIYCCLLAITTSDQLKISSNDLDDNIDRMYRDGAVLYEDDDNGDDITGDETGRISIGDLRDTLDQIERTSDTSRLKAENKRALSIFSRWRQLNSIGRRTNAINKNAPRAPMALMQNEDKYESGESSESRGRRVGQPLRWGR